MTGELLLKYFPKLEKSQLEKFLMLQDLYETWNSRINVISRKDIENFPVHHLLHSLAIGKVISFKPGTTVLDVGTGGGFPGIPLAILFPEAKFTLADSINKKITVVKEVAAAANIDNVEPLWTRAELLNRKFEFIVSRAVTSLPEFAAITRGLMDNKHKNSLPNGILYLKGGDIDDELKPFAKRAETWNINDFFDEPYFETKKVIFIHI
jgi:16S rRNA (guanine527-N7)-methyltransferase